MEAMAAQSEEVNWGPRSDVRWQGTPNWATQWRRKASIQLLAVVVFNGIASGHWV